MRPEILYPLFKEITSIKGIGSKTSQWLNYLCQGNRIIDLLWHLPNDVVHRPIYTKDPPLDTPITFNAKIIEYIVPPTRKRPLKILCQAQFGLLEIVLFHYHISDLTKKFPEETTVWLSGTLSQNKDHFEIVHPDFMSLAQNQIPEYEPIYSMTEGKKTSGFSRVMKNILPIVPKLPEWLSTSLLEQYHWPSWHQAIYQQHSPNILHNTDSKNRLVFDELLAQQLALKLIRAFHQRQQGINCPMQNKIQIAHPFQLTKGQEKVLLEIQKDLAGTFPMNRLLQGDVGSGKTIVAVLAAIQTIENNFQVAFMAPTDILARQHFLKIKKLLEKTTINVELLTAKEKGKKREEILNRVSSGEIQLLIGTHALLEENVQFKNLALAVIDEQHRFGVNQRLNLRNKQKGCNLLVMSATPIPRSLAMTLYGDMDISILDEKPIGRQEIATRVMPLHKIPELVQKLADVNSQIYWVCPLVSETEKSDLMTAEKRFEDLQKVFPNQVGLIHGQMKASEKESIMQNFLLGKIKILVATTVIEVGVDVPNANIIIIEHAERFGLATLHQLRGRVGRGTQKASCILLHGKLGQNSKERLDLLRTTQDGFLIANKDLQLRGSGEMLGLRQSGFQQFKLSTLPEDQKLLDLANETAQNILKDDPLLQKEKNKNLHTLLYLFEREKAIMTLKAG